MVEWMGRNFFMFSLISRKFLAMRNIALYSVIVIQMNQRLWLTQDGSEIQLRNWNLKQKYLKPIV